MFGRIATRGRCLHVVGGLLAWLQPATRLARPARGHRVADSRRHLVGCVAGDTRTRQRNFVRPRRLALATALR